MIGVDSGNGYRFAQDKTEVDGNSVRSRMTVVKACHWRLKLGSPMMSPQRHSIPHTQFHFHLRLLSPQPPKQDEKAGRGWTGFHVAVASQSATTVSEVLLPVKRDTIFPSSNISVPMCLLRWRSISEKS
ncbi:hypothetical protein AYX13_03601 [Cryptococcus neoformans]|nr:hypothetical protein AYX13_03601 [Cryptococcus neoformans var. grubii]